eukprot:gene14898-6038_t
MKVIKSSLQQLNPSQTPVLVMDQPLFALAKQIQWSLDEFSEDRYVVMFGGLHIEMVFLKVLGKWLDGSGWAKIMCMAGVANQGVADSFLSACHVTRTRRAHQESRCFMQGRFVVHKTKRRFSSIAFDHAHEQENAIFKGQGGAVGLTEDPGALRRWIVAGPEFSRIIKEFEAYTFSEEDQKHHEQKPGFQRSFFRDVVNTVSSLEEFGNRFEEEGEYLLAIHTKDVKSNEAIETVRNAKHIGEEHFNLFLKE